MADKKRVYTSENATAVYVWSGIILICTCVVIWWSRKREHSRKKLNYSKESVLEARIRRFQSSETENEGQRQEENQSESIDHFVDNSDPDVIDAVKLSRSKMEKSQSKAEKFDNKYEHDPNLLNLGTLDPDGKKLLKIRLNPSSNLQDLPCFDKDTSLPVTRPLKTLDSVLQWMPGFDEFNIATIPLNTVVAENPNKPSTLVCHDMKGGYIEDRFVQGFNSDKCYRFYHWNYIDTFVYFSHNLVTIPPPCWTNAAHLHGVKVLGTFITEWEDGAKICEEFLTDEKSVKRLAEVLVQIATYYRFDGWLINIENEIRPVQVNNLIEFVKELTEQMHEARKESLVIWYDSVTYKGQLKWQDELNAENRAFFDVCDGIFLNYTWSVHHLFRSKSAAGQSRQKDVYVGVDCFGRGCFGGGGWNTYKAMQVIRDNALSAAIFAPGWVYETQGEEHFTENQNKFWHLLLSYLYPHAFCQLPLVSSLCQGYGPQVFCQGKVIKRVPWTNLSAQQLQPTFVGDYYQLGPKDAMTITSMQHSIEDSFNGGGCLKVEGEICPKEVQTRTVFRLFRCNIELREALFVSVTFKLSSLDQARVGLLFVLEGEHTYFLLEPSDHDEPNSESLEDDDSKTGFSREVKGKTFFNIEGQEDNYRVFQPIDARPRADEHTVPEGNCHSTEWCTRKFVIREGFVKSHRLKEVRVICGTKPPKGTTTPSPFSLLIGELQVMEVNTFMTDQFPSFTKVRSRDTSLETSTEDTAHLSTTISWDFKFSSKSNIVRCCDVFCSEQKTLTDATDQCDFGSYLGRTFVDSFRICKMTVPRRCKEGLLVTIQPLNSAYVRGSKSVSPQINITW